MGAGGYAGVVVAAGLAVGGAEGTRLGAVADAVAVGMEVAARLDGALGAALGAFDPVGCVGRLGAVAAAGRLLGLTVDAAAHAFGVAATQAAGFAVTAAGPIGDLQAGKAAADAVEAAYLARAGYTAGATAIEGRRGFAALLAPGASLDDVTDALGQAWTPHAGGIPATTLDAGRGSAPATTPATSAGSDRGQDAPPHLPRASGTPAGPGPRASKAGGGYPHGGGTPGGAGLDLDMPVAAFVGAFGPVERSRRPASGPADQ